MGPAASKFRSDSGLTEASRDATVPETRPRRHCYESVTVLVVVLAAFLLLQFGVPLRTAMQIGADEGFELAKATLCPRCPACSIGPRWSDRLGVAANQTEPSVLGQSPVFGKAVNL